MIFLISLRIHRWYTNAQKNLKEIQDAYIIPSLDQINPLKNLSANHNKKKSLLTSLCTHWCLDPDLLADRRLLTALSRRSPSAEDILFLSLSPPTHPSLLTSINNYFEVKYLQRIDIEICSCWFFSGRGKIPCVKTTSKCIHLFTNITDHWGKFQNTFEWCGMFWNIVEHSER
jgi:hypothetical protein